MLRFSTHLRRSACLLAASLALGCAARVRETPPATAADVSLSALQDAFTRTAERVSPSVVAIRVESRRPMGPLGALVPGNPQFQIQHGTGSGVVLRADGFILTNKHVVDNASRVEVVFRDGHKAIGKVVGIDDATDLAVVKVEASALAPAPFADSGPVRPGQWVMAVGSPFGLDYSVTVGVVSAIGRATVGMNEIEDYLQTDASINPGNSGGPLVNLNGEVIGINTMIVGGGTGIGFAIPSSIAQSVAEQLIAGGDVHRAFIGVAFQELTPELAEQFGTTGQGGALVSSIVPGGPAEKAGIAPGDVVLRVDGQAIGESRDLLRAILKKPIGVAVQLVVVRDRQPRTLSLVTVERPHSARAAEVAPPVGAAPSSQNLGLHLSPLTAELAQQLGYQGLDGAIVLEIARGGAAEHAGLVPGDLIVEADHRAVHTVADVEAALGDGSALLRVRRRDAALYVLLSVRD